MLVIDYLTGTTLENASFRDPDVLRRAAEGCRRLHEGPRFTGDFDMFRRQATYLATVREHGYRLFDGYPDHDGRLRAGTPRARGPARARRSRATTTCWPATSSTTATGCG